MKILESSILMKVYNNLKHKLYLISIWYVHSSIYISNVYCSFYLKVRVVLGGKKVRVAQNNELVFTILKSNKITFE